MSDAQKEMHLRTAKLLGKFIPLVISVVLLSALSFAVDLQGVAARLAQISPLYLGLAVTASMANVFVSSMRFRMILETTTGKPSRLAEIFGLNLLSVFAAHFLPVVAISDGLRVALAKLHFQIALREALESVVSDRVLAMAGLCLCAILVLPLQSWLGISSGLIILQLVAALVVLALLGLVLTMATRELLPARWHRASVEYVRRICLHLGSRVLLGSQLGLAFSGAILFALTLWFLALGLGLRLSVLAAFAFGPPIYFSQVVPFVYFGFGAREGVTMLFLVQTGLSVDSSFALGVAVGVCNLLVSLPAPFVASHLLGRKLS